MTAQATQDLDQKQLLEWLRISITPEFLKQQPMEQKKSPIAILENFRAFINPFVDPLDSKEYRKVINEQYCIGDKITELLPESQRSLLESYEDIMHQIANIDKNSTYRWGLRDGFMLALEMLCLERGV